MIRLSPALLSATLLCLVVLPHANAQDDLRAAPAPLANGLQDIAPDQEQDQEQQTIPLDSPFAFSGEMTAERLGALVKRVDPQAETLGNGYVFKVQDRDLRIVYDENADRMRIITPIIPAANLPDGLLQRMLQANFDSVLDSRYSIGSGNVWSSFVHRLSSLTDEDLISGIAQTTLAAETFGTSFSSGAFVFGGGDSAQINEELIENLRKSIEEAEDDRGI